MTSMRNIVLPLLLVATVLVAGCTAPQQQQAPLEQSIQDMRDFMEKNPDKLTPTQPAETDPGFSGSAVKGGSFQNINYMTSGSVEIQQQDGKSFIVLGEDFATPAGPDLVLYLTKNLEKTTREDVRAGLQIEKLKSTTGKQVYEVPAGTDLAQYNSVTIHCRAFNVPWSYAPLSA